MWRTRIFAAGAAVLLPALACADGIDCRRATAPLDRALCADPALLAQDRALAAAYRAALLRDPASAASTRAAQSRWLRDRQAACSKASDSRPTASVASCLAHQFAARIDALDPKAPVSGAASIPPPSSPPVVRASAEAPARPPVDTPSPLVLPTSPASRPTAAAARLDANALPASPAAETLLHVTAPGRFAISAHSASGAAITLVDIITGPSDPDGLAGSSDGRLDRLLDIGTYKLRVASAPGATGQVQLRAQPFHEAAAPASVPAQGEIDTSLGDLQQRSFWFAAGAAPIRLEAAGRALSEMKLWRDGRDLVALEPAISTIEPSPGHTLRHVLFEGTLPPGTYLATAYGGPALPWSDGGAAMPFHLRAGGADTLRAGWVALHVGPFGSEVFEASPQDDVVRLDMRGPARLSVDGQTVEIARDARAPSATLHVTAGKDAHTVVVQGAEGTPFQLRAAAVGASRSIDRPGTWWVTATSTGLGGDEPPATPVLARQEEHGLAVVASSAPEILPGHPWHTRFNLAGEVTLNLHVASGGRIAAVLAGLAGTRAALHPLGDPDAVPESHDAAHRSMPGVWDVPAGWYVLGLAPPGLAAGVADLTVGKPGESAPLAPPGPADPSFGFGARTVAKGESLVLLANDAPDATTGLDARANPVDLGAEPLRLSQAAGQSLTIPVRPGTQKVSALEIGRGPMPIQESAGEVTIAAPDHERLIALSRPTRPMVAAIPPPRPEAARQALHDGIPAFFDLEEGAQRSFSLDIPQGGLTRVETSGRLRTRGAIGTSFIPELATADANGIGQNMRAETWLRAGRYHVDVTAVDSAGHLGLVAAPAPVAAAATLVPGSTMRATMRAGSGLMVPIEIAQAGSYSLDLLGLGRIFTARLEDRDGWPLQVAAPFASTEQALAAGQYRLLVLPEQTDARAVIRLARVEKPVPLAGHGPHALPFIEEGEDGPLLTWREPAGRADPRTPDLWSFALVASANVTLGISDGMEAVLRAGDGHEVARFEGTAPFKASLPPGSYKVEARSQGRNDRLDYRISLVADELQPGVARTVDLPAKVSFVLAQDRVASLTSFGTAPLRATLRDAAGRVIRRYGARTDDWNVALSRLLPAGRYTLDLDSAAPPPMQPVPPNANDAAPQASAPPEESVQADPQPADQAAADQTSADQTAGDQGQADQPDQAQPASPDQAQPASPDQAQASPGEDAPGAPADAAPTSPAQARTAITLSLPEDGPAGLAQGDGGSVDVTLGGGLYHLPIRTPAAGGLLLAGAASSSAMVLSLEQRQGEAWQQRAEAQGTAPIIAWQGDGAGDAWRLSAWPVDGGNPTMRVAARQLAGPALPGAPHFAPSPLGTVAPGLATSHAALRSLDALSLDGDTAGLLIGAWPGHALAEPSAAPFAPQSKEAWLVSRQPGRLSLVPEPAGAAFATTLAPGAVLAMPAPDPTTGLAAWIAEAEGQPGFAAASGWGAGVAPNSAFALAVTGLTLANAGGANAGGANAGGANAGGADAGEADAGGDNGLRVAVRPVALARQPDQALQAPWSGMLPPASALKLTLPNGARALHLTLAARLAAISGWPGLDQVTAWSGPAALSRTLDAASPGLLLVNTGAVAAPAAVDWSGDPVGTLRPDGALKRFFGAAGSFDLPVQASNGQLLVIAGDASAVFTGGGRVLRGTRFILPGPGRVTIDHGLGLVAAWLEGQGATPWPSPAPMAVALPGRVTLAGPAMRLTLSPAAPSLLRLRSDAPVILAFAGEAPHLFAGGAAIDRFLGVGPASLLVVSPQNGPLSGTLDLAVTPVLAASEGLGAPVALAPGEAAAFGFRLDAKRRVGLGVQAEPDRVEVSLLDASGEVVSHGNAAMLDLAAGSYLLQVRVPADATPTIVRPAIVGTGPHPSGPPAEVIETFRRLAGLKVSKP